VSGLLVDGKVIPVPGVQVIGRHEEAWAFLSPGDCRPRRDGSGHAVWPHQWMLHKTIADDPEKLIPGIGPSGGAGGARPTAEYWQNDPKHSGAHLITGHNGELVCLADLVQVMAYHATVSNLYSVGHETKELVGGGFYEAAARTTVEVTLAGCRALGIQWQMPHQYSGQPLTRMMVDGGRDCFGIFGHRDNTTARGRWDPGDILPDMLHERGVMRFDFEHREDIAFWMTVQTELAARKFYHGAIDGIPGPGTTAALKADGYIDGILALGKQALPDA